MHTDKIVARYYHFKLGSLMIRISFSCSSALLLLHLFLTAFILMEEIRLKTKICLGYTYFTRASKKMYILFWDTSE